MLIHSRFPLTEIDPSPLLPFSRIMLQPQLMTGIIQIQMIKIQQHSSFQGKKQATFVGRTQAEYLQYSTMLGWKTVHRGVRASCNTALSLMHFLSCIHRFCCSTVFPPLYLMLPFLSDTNSFIFPCLIVSIVCSKNKDVYVQGAWGISYKTAEFLFIFLHIFLLLGKRLVCLSLYWNKWSCPTNGIWF